MSRNSRTLWLVAVLSTAACAGQRCGESRAEVHDDTRGSEERLPPPSERAPDDLPNALLIASAQFPLEPGGKPSLTPGAARLEIVSRRAGAWTAQVIEDEESNVFHKAIHFQPAAGEPGILTFGGMAAAVKLWRRREGRYISTVLWQERFGGKFDRMRDAEVGDLYGDGAMDIAIATHDQGVVAVLRERRDEGYEVVRLDRQPDTFVHEIELGDLDGDGTLEVYATPSEPNKLRGGEQRGVVVRYIPRTGEARRVVADLGTRHAKEIWVGDLDDDGRDELYVAVEAETSPRGDRVEVVHPVEIRRYDADTVPTGGA